MSISEKMRSITEKECPVDVLLKEIKAYKCTECGKCVFGYEGITQLELILNDFTMKKAKSSDIPLIRELCELMKTQTQVLVEGGFCTAGKELAEAVLTALDTYKDDFESHAAKKSCRAGVCKKFMTYHILADKCTGCTECLDVCEDDAIKGKKKFIHVIDQNECTQCGKCMDVCDEDAIVTAGTVKPRCPKKPIPVKR